MAEGLIRGTVILISIHVMLFLGQIVLANIGVNGMENYDKTGVLGTFYQFDIYNKPVGLSSNISEALPSAPVTSGGFSSAIPTSSSNLIFVDPLKLIWNIIKLTFGLIIAPITIFLLIPSLNVAFVMLLGVPLFIMYLYGVIYFLRGLNG